MTDKFDNNRRQQWWRSINSAEGPDACGDEFPPGADQPPAVPDCNDSLSRRRFLSLLASSAALATAAGCSSPRDRGDAVPYNKRPPEMIPGVANYYATTQQEGPFAYSLLAKAREGRPVLIEGNDRHPRAQGKTGVRAMADLFTLYDAERRQQPLIDGEPKSWQLAQQRVTEALKSAKQQQQSVVLVSGSIISPSRTELLMKLRRQLPQIKHVQWEPLGYQALRQASQQLFQHTAMLRPRFDKAQVILALEADFLGAMGDAALHSRLFGEGRRVRSRKDNMSRLYVAEGRMSLTGMNADLRVPIRSSGLAELAFCLAGMMHRRYGLPYPPGTAGGGYPYGPGFANKYRVKLKALEKMAADLARAKGKALVVVGPEQSLDAHLAGHLLNRMLQASEDVLESANQPNYPALAGAQQMEELADEMQAGKHQLLILWDVNPVYSFYLGDRFREAMHKVPLRVHIGTGADESSAECQVALAANHWLESWGDYAAQRDVISMQQPLIAPLFDTRQAEEIILEWINELDGSVPTEYRRFMQQVWRENFYGQRTTGFESFWNAVVHDGFYRREVKPRKKAKWSGSKVRKALKRAVSLKPVKDSIELTLYSDAKMYDGRYAHNGWLQELPDPVTKVVWGNPLQLAPGDAARLGVKDDDVVTVTSSQGQVTTPVVIQPGQAAGVAALALGYGRRGHAVAEQIGVNAYPLASSGSFGAGAVKIEPAGRQTPVARTQDHHFIGDLRSADRELVRSARLDQYRRGEHLKHSPQHGHKLHTLYPEHKPEQYKWEMTIDLNSCIGCSSCVIACQSENNIPVVGADQVAKGREMHWLRIDRYYVGDRKNPAVRLQPVPCQHCDNAPCESVCPVAATTQSPEGLNQMTYNRCVGTRYCANNCPYKVRRFNFFDLTQKLPPPRQLLFNPEVTVRPRGVMEKCTFCVQRIQDAKQRVKKEKRMVRDEDLKTACQSACPTEAIAFGNRQDAESEVSQLAKDDRSYHLLEQLGVKPAVTYLMKLDNKPGGRRRDGS